MLQTAPRARANWERRALVGQWAPGKKNELEEEDECEEEDEK